SIARRPRPLRHRLGCRSRAAFPGDDALALTPRPRSLQRAPSMRVLSPTSVRSASVHLPQPCPCPGPDGVADGDADGDGGFNPDAVELGVADGDVGGFVGPLLRLLAVGLAEPLEPYAFDEALGLDVGGSTISALSSTSPGSGAWMATRSS